MLKKEEEEEKERRRRGRRRRRRRRRTWSSRRGTRGGRSTSPTRRRWRSVATRHPLRPSGRGRRGGRGGRLVPPLFLAALVVDNDSGSLAVPVLLVTMYLALYSLLASYGPRCSASWPVWTRRTVAVAFTWLVLLVTMHLALCSLPWFAGPFLDFMVQTVQNPVQVQFWDEVVVMPVVGQRLALMVQTVPKPVEFPQVQPSPLLWRRGKSPWSR